MTETQAQQNTRLARERMVEAMQETTYCECGDECAPEVGVCDECSIRRSREQDERELRAHREQRESDQQDWLEYQRR